MTQSQQYDLNLLIKQRKHLIECIEEGDWTKYPESLKVRKRRLASMNQKIKAFKEREYNIWN